MSDRFAAKVPWILGLDLGSNSVGWAAMRLDAKEAGDPEKAHVIGFLSTAEQFQTHPCMGSRIFDVAVENYGQGKGKEESLNVKRRMARLQRRQAQRRARRRKKTFNTLVRLGLLPAPTREELAANRGSVEVARDLAMKRLDVALLNGLCGKVDLQTLERAGYHLPYVLRARALDARLTPQELGRALYHLAQRRGYKSNRKAKAQDEAEESAEAGNAAKAGASKKKLGVLDSISALGADMQATGARTLGEYFSRIEPGLLRIRKRWTSRSMYEAEFDAMLDAQVKHGGVVLGRRDRKHLRRAIFHQRPLKSCRDLIGLCGYEDGAEWTRQASWPHLGTDETILPRLKQVLTQQCWCGAPQHGSSGFLDHKHVTAKRRRAPEFFLESQRYRILDKVNNLTFAEAAEVKLIPLGTAQLQRLEAAFKDEAVLKLSDATKALALGEGASLVLGTKKAPAKLTKEHLPELQLKLCRFGKERDLTCAEKRQLADRLNDSDGMTMAAAKSLLGFENGGRFNIERGGDTKFHGNRTNAGFLEIFGDRWKGLTDDQRRQAVLEVWSFDDATLVRRAKEQAPIGDGSLPSVWKLLQTSPTEAQKLLRIPMSSDYMSLSIAAMKKLLPLLELGIGQVDAKLAIYGSPIATETRELLPPVEEVLTEMRNPVVMRALTEMRRVVNALVRLYGRPSFIRVELARDIKQNAEQRYQTKNSNREREEEREAARNLIRNLTGQAMPSRSDVDKVLLHAECGGVCPYTGKIINFNSLFDGSVDIEHIIPFSISQDDSFNNRTLCDSHFNKNVKRNQTPWQAMAANPGQWVAAVQRVRLNVEREGMSRQKLRRFCVNDAELPEFVDEFRSQQLNDTKYAAKMSIRYLAQLYGGNLEQGVDPKGIKRVQSSTGQVTSALRSRLGMPRALGGEIKTRDDHRHHAIDAVAVAMAGPAEMKRLADASKESFQEFSRAKFHLHDPWPTFRDELKASVDAIVVSHRVSNPVRGALHKETYFSPPRTEQGARQTGEVDGPRWHHLRVPVNSLSQKDLASIVDANVRAAVIEKLAGREDPKMAFDPESPETLPRLKSKSHPAGFVLIRRVRIHFKSDSAQRIGQKPHRQRWADNDQNHHMELFECTDSRGRVVWRSECVSGIEAQRRKLAGEPVVGSARHPGEKFLFSLSKREVLEVEHKGARKIAIVTSIKQNGQVFAKRYTEARPVGKGGGEEFSVKASSMFDGSAMKYAVDAIGRMRSSHA